MDIKGGEIIFGCSKFLGVVERWQFCFSAENNNFGLMFWVVTLL